MSFEPINIFSNRIDPKGVADLLRSHGRTTKVQGADDIWESIVVEFSPKTIFRKARVLTIGHDPEYYDGPDWSKQILGMQGYFSNFPESDVTPKLMRLIRSFRFALAIRDDINIDGQDDRLELIYSVCQHLDGAIFTPSSLRDAGGRILLSSNGETDPNAVWPRVPPTEDHPEAIAPDSFDESEEDDFELVTQAPTSVARRALALTAVAARATLEMDAPHMDDAEVHRKRIEQWVNDIGIMNELEPDEAKVVQRPVGTLDERAFIDSMWRVEGLGVLAWALGLYELPPYDELVVPPDLYQSVGLFDNERAVQLLNSPSLRSEDEIVDMNEHLLGFHWRVRNFSLSPVAMDFVEFCNNCWFGSFDVTKFQIVEGDLALGGVPIAKAPLEVVDTARSTAQERHLAINWLRGHSQVYSETDTST